nr:MAG TPA: hypothetical protein [Caudoviricetes sp.]
MRSWIFLHIKRHPFECLLLSLLYLVSTPS